MIIRKAFAAGSAALLLSVPSVALAGSDKQAAEIVSEDDAKAKADATVRCKRLPPPVGSRMGGKKVCKTNAAWRLEREAAEQAARENMDRSGAGNTRTSG